MKTEKTGYQAIFEIDCGVSPGYGVKYPDRQERTERIVADTPQAAYQNVMSMAEKFAYDYMSNPENGLTTVRLLSLRGSDGPVPFDAQKSVVRRSMLEHLLALASEEKRAK